MGPRVTRTGCFWETVEFGLRVALTHLEWITRVKKLQTWSSLSVFFCTFSLPLWLQDSSKSAALFIKFSIKMSFLCSMLDFKWGFRLCTRSLDRMLMLADSVKQGSCSDMRFDSYCQPLHRLWEQSSFFSKWWASTWTTSSAEFHARYLFFSLLTFFFVVVSGWKWEVFCWKQYRYSRCLYNFSTSSSLICVVKPCWRSNVVFILNAAWFATFLFRLPSSQDMNRGTK